MAYPSTARTTKLALTVDARARTPRLTVQGGAPKGHGRASRSTRYVKIKTKQKFSAWTPEGEGEGGPHRGVRASFCFVFFSSFFFGEKLRHDALVIVKERCTLRCKRVCVGVRERGRYADSGG